MKKFGDLVKKYRGEKTLKILGDELGITSAYLSDIERGNRYPSKILLEKFVENFKLEGEKRNLFYDAFAKENYEDGKISVDIAEYIMKNEMLRKFIRITKEKKVNKEYWNILITELEKE